MLSLDDALKLVEEKLQEITFPEEPGNLYDPVRYILSNGGKRIRPALVLLGANVFKDDVKSALDPAMAVEIFHNFTLLHDDLMDNSKIRRGKETVHLKWNPDIAILSGDAMSIIANQYVSKVSPGILPRVLKVFNQTAVEVCEGQMLDMSFETRDEVNVSEYIQMIGLKTSVLIAASLEIGACCGGASELQAKELYQFGKFLGIAFQLQDDYLDSYGDTETFGKKVGNDILSNKKTYLMISALEKVNEEDKKKLTDWLTKKDFDPDQKITEVKKIFDKYGVGDFTRSKIQEYFNSAMAKLEKIEVEPERKMVLKEFAGELMGRER